VPFVSQAQRRKFYADPALRKYVAEFEKSTPKGAKLPGHVADTRKGPTMAAAPNSKAPLGQGGRFAAVAAKTGSPALAAFIGRKKYGKAKFQSLAKKGKAHHRAAALAKMRAGEKAEPKAGEKMAGGKMC